MDDAAEDKLRHPFPGFGVVVYPFDPGGVVDVLSPLVAYEGEVRPVPLVFGVIAE